MIELGESVPVELPYVQRSDEMRNLCGVRHTPGTMVAVEVDLEWLRPYSSRRGKADETAREVGTSTNRS